MNSEQLRTKALGLLGICIRAGKAVRGADPSAQAVSSGKAGCVITASDASERTVRGAENVCERYGVPHYRLPITVEDTERLFRKPAAVIAVCDKGFADGFARLITDTTE
jgi:ribosomal protein L7Ae-like RNA K-turn-binding protein